MSAISESSPSPVSFSDSILPLHIMKTSLLGFARLLGSWLALMPLISSANYADSPNITVDTRTLVMTELVISGPPSVPWGQDAPFSAELSYEGSPPEDVTSLCTWSVSGGPPGINWWELASMDGNVLKPGVVSPVPLKISATFTRDNGRISSNVLSVIVEEGNGMNIGIGRPVGAGPNYVGKSGVNFTWNYAAVASGLALMKPGVTVVWYLDGGQVGTGASLSSSFTGQPGTRELKVVATDAEGRTGQSIRQIPFNVPPVTNEPEPVPASDPGIGDVVDEDGNAFSFNPLHTSNGLVVVTHGLNGSSSDEWLRAMAEAVRVRLLNESKPMPNIVVFGWEYWASPSQYWGVDVPYAGLAEDIILIRPHGLSMGRELANWIRYEIGEGNVSASAPVHLIGHSAGGFVVGECGYQLRASLDDVRVTMLDTPYPAWTHLTSFPGTGRKLDRYVSSLFGSLENPLSSAVEAVAGKYDYVLLGLVPTVSAHSYSHEWYENTVFWGSIGSRGFGWSPMLAGASAAMPAPPVTKGPAPAPAPEPIPLSESESPLSGFTTFGLVSTITDGYLISEGDQANSGIVLAGYTMPAGAQTISFRFQFTNVGDGDFLVVSHGETVIGYGSDNSMSESEELTVNMPVEHLAGQTGDLVFRLMSRGEQNAVVSLKGVTITEVDDADLDGLTNSEESAAGTNPLVADTDGDGIDDPTELNTTLTNPTKADSDGDGANDGAELAAGTDPLDGSSRFAVRSSVKQGDSFTISWASVAGRTYRILRSPTPDFATYDVVSSGIAAVPPEQWLVDEDATAARAFYRVELEP